MDRRIFLAFTAPALAGTLVSAVQAAPSTTPRITNAGQLDVGVDVAGGTGDALRLPALLQRRSMLLAVDGDSRAAATWLADELRRLQPELLEELVVLLVEPVRDATPPPLFDAAPYAGLRIYRTTAAAWRRAAPGPVLPQLMGFADGGRLRLHRIGSDARRLGLAQFHSALLRETGGLP